VKFIRQPVEEAAVKIWQDPDDSIFHDMLLYVGIPLHEHGDASRLS